MEKTALILFDDEKCNMWNFLPHCIRVVEEENCVPILNNSTKKQLFIARIAPFVDVIYLFTNFGVDDYMMDIIENYSSQKELRYRKIPEERLAPALKEIFYDVANKCDVSTIEMSSKSRKREICDARFIYCYRARIITKESLEAIGKLINRSHADVLHGIRQVIEVPQLNKKYRQLYEETIIKKKTMVTGEDKQCSSGQGKRPLLPHNKMENGEQKFSRSKSFMRALLGFGPDSARGNNRS